MKTDTTRAAATENNRAGDLQSSFSVKAYKEDLDYIEIWFRVLCFFYAYVAHLRHPVWFLSHTESFRMRPRHSNTSQHQTDSRSSWINCTHTVQETPGSLHTHCCCFRGRTRFPSWSFVNLFWTSKRCALRHRFHCAACSSESRSLPAAQSRRPAAWGKTCD